MSELCLTLLCSPAVEETLLDFLLMSPNTTVFTSSTIAAHGVDHKNLDQMERVLGKARATQIQVIVGSGDKEALLSAIRKQFAGAGLRYWVMPIVEAGDIT